MLKILRIIIRLSLLSAHLVTGALVAAIILTKPIKSLGLYDSKKLIRRWLFVAGYFTGCRIANQPSPINHPTLIISNHVSWLDILVIGGLYEVHFLSKEEVKKWPIIGFLTVISGTLLIKRGSGSEGAINEIQQALLKGDNVSFFPEGTTSSGFETKAFHSRLLKSAYQTDASISVLSLSYSTDNKTRDEKMGWKKQILFNHLFYVLGQKTSFVKVNLVQEVKQYQHMQRKELAQHCRQLIDDDLKRNHYPCHQQH